MLALTGLSRSPVNSHTLARLSFATACNQLDVTTIEGLLAKDVHYDSELVVDEPYGKAAVLEHISASLGYRTKS